MRAAIYARVSTANSGQDPTMQTRELVEYCERRAWKVVDEYVDVGISGAKEKRPELDRMMADAHRRRNVHTNTIENFWSLLKRGIIGSFHKVSEKHLRRYLAEFTYQFNRRDMHDLFSETLVNLLGTINLTYRELVTTR